MSLPGWNGWAPTLTCISRNQRRFDDVKSFNACCSLCEHDLEIVWRRMPTV